METEKGALQEKLNAMVIRFGKITAGELTQEDKKEIIDHIQEISTFYHGYSTYGDIQISSAENFFHNMKSILEIWLKEKAFVDREVFRVITQTIVTFYLDKERNRKFTFITDAGWGHTVHDSDTHHISWCETTAGDCMSSFGFFEDALGYYKQALRTAGFYYRSAANHTKKSMRKLIANYRTSGQKIPIIDSMIDEQISKIIHHTKGKTVKKIHTLPKWTHSACYWDQPLKKARELLAEMGFSESEQHQLLRPVYEMVIPALIKDRKKVIEEQKKYNQEPEKINWRSKDLAEIYRLLNDEKSSLKWEMVYLNANK